MNKKNVYVDNAATTAISPIVLESMLPYFKENYGNASSVYSKGRQARTAIETARHKVAVALGVKNDKEIFFTSCGTESDNWAIKGVAKMQAKNGKKHIVTTVYEHHAVLHSFEALEKEGFETTYLKVDKDGLITAEDVKSAIRPDTALVSIMYANNEIGTVLPIGEIGKVCREKGVVFHTDAVQAIGNINIDVEQQNIDILSLSAHKINGPKGIGALYIRSGIKVETFMDGGAQENHKRAGTENVAFIVGLGTAIEYVTQNLDERVKSKTALRNRYIDGILSTVTHSHLNGSRTHRLCGNANISFEGVEGEGLLLMLDMNGISASSGSACTSGSLDPSHVLMSIGLSHEVAHGSLRVTFGDYNTEEDVDYLLEVVPNVVGKLRAMSPLWEKIIKQQN